MKRLIITEANLIDGKSDEVKKNSYVVIKDGLIEEVGEGKPCAKSEDIVVSAEGCTIIPGFIDAHVHLVWDGGPDPNKIIKGQPEAFVTTIAVKNAQHLLRLGITTVRDVGAPGNVSLSIAKAVKAGYIFGPTVIAAGPPICMTGGHCHDICFEADGPEQVRHAARAILKNHADLIKVMATGGIYTEGEEPGSAQLSVDEIKAAVEEAHKRNKKVASHAEGLEGIRNSLDAGVDTIEHGIYADEVCLQRMVDQGTYLIPTITTMRKNAEGGDGLIPSFAVEKAKKVVDVHFKTLEKAIKMGVKIVTGTDCGAPCNPPECYFEELKHMKEAGMTSMEVIKASTSVAAEALGLENTGCIKPGFVADFIVIEGDPMLDLNILDNIRQVFKKGVPVNGKILWP
jgi:imidazolonepropionase-like amidohydrolase